MGKGGEYNSNFLSLTVAALLGGVIAALTALILLFFCAAAISSGILPQKVELQVTVISCVIGSFLGGNVTRRRWRCKPLLAGMSAGAVFFLILLTISLIGYDAAGVSGSGIGVLAGCMCGGAVSGMMGGKKKKKKKRN